MEKCKFIVYLEEREYVWLVLTTNAVCVITGLYCVLITQLDFLGVTLLLICMMELARGAPQVHWHLSSFENCWPNLGWGFQLNRKLLGAG